MSTWHTGPFDNDEALDFFDRVEALNSADVVPTLRETLCAVLERPGVVEVNEGQVAVAAATLVAAGRSRLARTGNPAVDSWLADHRPAVDTEDQQLALRVLERVCGPDSEWMQLWTASEHEPDLGELRAVLAG
jgi:hypothetical protein